MHQSEGLLPYTYEFLFDVASLQKKKKENQHRSTFRLSGYSSWTIIKAQLVVRIAFSALEILFSHGALFAYSNHADPFTKDI